jgi:hypothetical protein
MPSRGELLGYKHMSSGGPYITSTVYMLDGTQVYQEEPSDPTVGEAEAKTQGRQEEPSPLTTSKAKAQA